MKRDELRVICLVYFPIGSPVLPIRAFGADPGETSVNSPSRMGAGAIISLRRRHNTTGVPDSKHPNLLPVPCLDCSLPLGNAL